ncbi:MAG TPA: PDZ domain-containing protein [Polyangiaceae bacterium]
MKPAAFVTVALALLSPPAFAQQALPSLPGPGAASAPANTAPAAAGPTTPQQLYEHVRRGVVVVMKNGVPAAIGTVLGTDGRILTALSGLGGAEGADVLYADGTTVHAKVGNTDAADDLALLVPAARKFSDGLAASELDPIGAQIRALLPSRGAKLAPAQADVKGKADAHARDGAPLLQMLDVDVKGPLIAGAPLLDSTGGVVAVLVRACKGAVTQQQASPAKDENANPWAGWGSAPQATAKAAACAPVVVGAPVATIRSFLTKTPAAAPAPAPWLGIRGETAGDGQVRGVRVLAVAPKSPAEAAGLKSAGDVIAAVDGQSVDSPEKLADAIAKHAPGETVKLLVFGDGRFREVPVVLRAAQ